MSVHYEEPGKRWVVRFRDGDGKQRCVTANALNFVKYELPVPERIARRAVRRLEAEVLRRETAADGSIRSADRRKTMYLDVVAKYVPPLLSVVATCARNNQSVYRFFLNALQATYNPNLPYPTLLPEKA